MRKRGYSFRGFWGQTKHYDNQGNFKGQSNRNFWGGRTHRDADFNVKGYSYRNFWGGYTRYDKDMNKIGYSYKNFWGGINYFDKDMNLTGSSYRNFFGGRNNYDRRDERYQDPSNEGYPLAGITYSDARINVDSEKAAFVDYGETGSDYNGRMSKSQRAEQREFNDVYAEQKDTRDLWGLEAIRGKTCEEILVILKKTKLVMDDLYNYLSEDSGFRKELMDDRQMYKDFWLYILAQQLEISSFTSDQKVKVLGLLLDVLKVENPTSAAKHYDLMNSNSDYKKYMTDCFSARTPCEGFFWTNLSHMGSVYDDQVEQKIKEHVPLVMNFSIGYFRFFMQLEVYLKKMFSGYGFGENMKNRLLEKMDAISETFTNDIELEGTIFLNPIYDIWVNDEGGDEDV